MSHLKVLIKNMRPYRSVHYSGLVLGGAFIACWHPAVKGSFSEYLMRIIFLFSGIIFAFQAACVFNDFYDINGDRVSNPDRPLLTGKVSASIYKKWGLFCFFVSVILSYLAGLVPLILILCCYISAVFYSMPPFRLKRFFPLNTLVIALNALIAVVAGFSVIAGYETPKLFPHRVAIMIFVVFMFSINIKDIKDREGDLVEGIKTIPTIMGERLARAMIIMLTVLAYFSVPVILGITALYYFSIAGSVLGVYWLLKKKWDEGPYFVTYYVYSAVMFLFLRSELMYGGII